MLCPTTKLMSKPVQPSASTKKLSVELDRAETFVVNAIGNYTGTIPATLLVIFKKRRKHPPQPFFLFDPEELEISIMSDLRSSLREVGADVALTLERQPIAALSMIEMPKAEQAFWLKKGFFPSDAMPEQFIDQDTLLMTASNDSGQTIRRLVRIDQSPLLLSSASRQLGRSVQVELGEEASEMSLFWQSFTAARARLSR